MVQEMIKLRELLNEHGIEWHDASTPPDYPLQIDRTHFDYKGSSWSVINGFGSHGGYDSFHHKENMGLLELMSAAVSKGEPLGYLTANLVIKLVLQPKETEFALATSCRMLARELKIIMSSNNERKMRHEPMLRRLTFSRHRRMKRTQPKKGKLRNKHHEFT